MQSIRLIQNFLRLIKSNSASFKNSILQNYNHTEYYVQYKSHNSIGNLYFLDNGNRLADLTNQERLIEEEYAEVCTLLFLTF